MSSDSLPIDSLTLLISLWQLDNWF